MQDLPFSPPDAELDLSDAMDPDFQSLDSPRGLGESDPFAHEPSGDLPGYRVNYEGSGNILEERERRKAEREKERRIEKRKEKEECIQAMKNFRPSKLDDLDRGTDTGLPLDIWNKILCMLCDDIEEKGVRSVGMCARDLASVSITCKELKFASREVFEKLAGMCDSDLDSQFDEFLKDPEACDLPELRRLTKKRKDNKMFDLNSPRIYYYHKLRLKEYFKVEHKSQILMTSATKPVLIMNLLRSFGVSHPSSQPAKILEAVLREKMASLVDCSQLYYKMRHSPDFDYSQSLFTARVICTQNGFHTLEQVQF